MKGFGNIVLLVISTVLALGGLLGLFQSEDALSQLVFLLVVLLGFVGVVVSTGQFSPPVQQTVSKFLVTIQVLRTGKSPDSADGNDQGPAVPGAGPPASTSSASSPADGNDQRPAVPPAGTPAGALGAGPEGNGDAAPSLPMVASAVALVGVAVLLVVVAVPAFLKYIKRSKTSEATMNIRKLHDGSVAYFGAEHHEVDGTLLPAQFPVSTPILPERVPPGAKVEAPAFADVPTWQALRFSVTDPLFYAYQYDSDGTGNAGQFTASAFGDLDGDGTLSTFARFGTVVDMEVRGAAALFIQNEME